jgi:hypothetical protein
LSRPIIENSTGITFAAYPRVIAETLGIDAREEDWYVKGLVEDFNWLRREHSPNWSIAEKTGDDIWSTVLENLGKKEVDAVIDLVINR